MTLTVKNLEEGKVKAAEARMYTKNGGLARRAAKCKEEIDWKKYRQEKLEEMMKDEEKLRGLLSVLFSCPLCNSLLTPPSPIYQCRDGHILCQQCRYSEKMKVGEVERSEYESP